MISKVRPTASLAALILGVAVLLTQFVSLGREVIDPDESTFILMGADVAKGHLPFVAMFDLKPPMIFLLIGSVLAAFGKSLVAVRLLGDLLLFGTAMLTFRFARQVASGWAALGGALSYVAFASMDLGQPTYSELPALFFGMFALLMLVRTPVSPSRAALAGLGLALAVLSRTNLYQLPIVFGLLLLIAALRKSDHVHPRAWLAFGLGGLVPVGCLLAAYTVTGQLAVLKLAMIDVPLAYAQQVGPLAALIEHIGQFYVTATMEPLIVIPFVLLVLGGLWQAVRAWRDKTQRWTLTLVGLALAALLVSLAFSGAVYPHYWLQLLPVLAVLSAMGLDCIARLPRALPLAVLAGLLPITAAAAERLPQAAEVISDPAATEAHFQVAKAARFITAQGGPQASVWPWRYQLVSWYLDDAPLSKAGVQPENIGRPPIVGPLAEEGYVGPDEIGRLMQLRPDFIVTDAKGKGQAWLRETEKPIDAWMAQNYELEAQFGDVLVYRRFSY
jgi:4-amino-4-deoxy-L-arabinose transferase-like glycosyltransferase